MPGMALNWRCVISGGNYPVCGLRAMRGMTLASSCLLKDILNIEREVDSSGSHALYGRGKGVETESGFTAELTFADIEAPGKPLARSGWR